MKIVVDDMIAVRVSPNIFNDNRGGWCLFVCFSFALKGKYFLSVNEVCVLVTLAQGMDCFGFIFFFSIDFLHVTFLPSLKFTILTYSSI